MMYKIHINMDKIIKTCNIIKENDMINFFDKKKFIDDVDIQLPIYVVRPNQKFVSFVNFVDYIVKASKYQDELYGITKFPIQALVPITKNTRKICIKIHTKVREYLLVLDINYDISVMILLYIHKYVLEKLFSEVYGRDYCNLIYTGDSDIKIYNDCVLCEFFYEKI